MPSYIFSPSVFLFIFRLFTVCLSPTKLRGFLLRSAIFHLICQQFALHNRNPCQEPILSHDGRKGMKGLINQSSDYFCRPPHHRPLPLTPPSPLLFLLLLLFVLLLLLLSQLVGSAPERHDVSKKRKTSINHHHISSC